MKDPTLAPASDADFRAVIAETVFRGFKGPTEVVKRNRKFAFDCPHCSRRLQWASSQQKGNCQHCSEPIEVLRDRDEDNSFYYFALPPMTKAENDLIDFTRQQMRKDGFCRKISPPIPLPPSDETSE